MLRHQHCQSIYAAIDSSNYRAALQHCDNLLRNTQAATSHTLARALKALALFRLQRRSEAAAEVDAVCNARDARSLQDVQVLAPLTFVLNRLGRRAQAADLLDGASKSSPADTELGKMAFEAHIVNDDYLRAQQVAARMQKASSEATSQQASKKQASSSDTSVQCSSSKNRYFWWSIQAYLLLATETPEAQGAALALTLAERMIQNHVATKAGSFDEKSDQDIELYLELLLEQSRRASNSESKGKKRQEALDLFSKEPGQGISQRSLALGQKKFEILKDAGQWQTLRTESQQRIAAGDRNWMTIENWIEAEVGITKQEAASADTAFSFVESLIEKEGPRREYLLARLFLHHELRRASCSKIEASEYVALLSEYFEALSSKTCCFEDLLPLLEHLSPDEASSLATQQPLLDLDVTAASTGEQPSFSSERDVVCTVNAIKIRSQLVAPPAGQGSSQTLARRLLDTFYASLPCSAKAPKTVPRPAADLVLIAAQHILAGSLSSPSTLILLLSLLAHASLASPASYAIKLLSLRIYLALGCPLAARALWKETKIRGVQNESLGWLWYEDYSISQEDEGSLDGNSAKTSPFTEWRKEAERLYNETATEGPSMMMQAFERGNYSSVKEIIDFVHCLDRSTQRLGCRLEDARRAALQERQDEAQASESDARSAFEEVNEAKKKGLKLQWDFSVLPAFAHTSIPGLVQSTGKSATVSSDAANDGRHNLTLSLARLAALKPDIELPDSLISEVESALASPALVEEERLFLQCVEAIRKASSAEDTEMQRTVAALVDHVGAYFAAESNPLPSKESRLVELLLDVVDTLRIRFPSDVKLVEPICAALQQLATTLKQRTPSSLLEVSADDTATRALNEMLRSTLDAQRGGQGAREKVVKDVKDEVSKRRKRLAQKVAERLAR